MREIGYLGLGSNVGDRRMNLQATIELLWTHDVIVLASSAVYETEPVGEVLDQRAFYNACVRIETRLRPEKLLEACKAVEHAFGRKQVGEEGYVKDGPRAIDVDDEQHQGPTSSGRPARTTCWPVNEASAPAAGP